MALPLSVSLVESCSTEIKMWKKGKASQVVVLGTLSLQVLESSKQARAGGGLLCHSSGSGLGNKTFSFEV